MRSFSFFDPFDGTVREANEREILKLLRERGEAYWNNPEGGGFAGLVYYPEGQGVDPGGVAGLDFTKLDRFGFHFYYRYETGLVDSPYYREAEHYYSHNGNPLTSRSPINWAEEGRLIFDALFVDLPTAEAIVSDFLVNGERSSRAAWLRGRVIRTAERALEGE